MIPQQRKISGGRIVSDIRWGMTAVELMKKYDLSLTQLKSVLAQLETAGFHVPELYGRAELERDSVSESGIRRLPRYRVIPHVPVHDVKDPLIKGRLFDISDKGLGVAGMEIRVQEVRSLIVLADQFFAIDPFQVRAVCRWGRPTGPEQRYVAGFEITNITERSLGRLRSLIEALNRAETASTRVEIFGPDESPARGEDPEKTAWTCPFCKMPQAREYDECPQCGIIVSKYIHRLERTRTEVLDIVEKESRWPDTSANMRDKQVRKTITISEKLWNDLKSLGGNADDHIAEAVSTYLSGATKLWPE